MKVKMNALRRAILVTMTRHGMKSGQIRKMQTYLNKCLEGGLDVDFKNAVLRANSLPQQMQKEIMGRYVANLNEEVN